LEKDTHPDGYAGECLLSNALLSAGGVGVSTGTLGEVFATFLARGDRCGEKTFTAKAAKTCS
jgi:hypothetical protein